MISASLDSPSFHRSFPPNATQQEPLHLLASIARLPKGSPVYFKAVEEFLIKHVGLAYDYAEKWRTPKIPQEDLRQQAILGLLEAIHLWNPGKATFFSTYAVYRMRYQISRFVDKKWPLVHMPQNALEDRRLVKKAVRQLHKDLCREPTPEEIRAKIPELSSLRLELALSYQGGLHFESLQEDPSEFSS